MYLYQPLYECPAPGPCPEDKNGFITFGSCAALHKLTPTTLRLWKAAMDAVPNSRFILARDEFAHDPGTRDYWIAQFEKAGIARDRFEAVTGTKDDFVRLRFYDKIDIILDTFPYSGATTTTDALWMGVPVVNFRQTHFINRVCSSLLTRVNLQDLVAEKEEDFPKIAAALAANHERRADLRLHLRDTMRHGPLGNAAGMASDMERAIMDVLSGKIKPRE
jgi:predicted O-linked N-acetylglucosamine transferase (SPINDLY family)